MKHILTLCREDIFTARKRSCFLHLSVILFERGGGLCPGRVSVEAWSLSRGSLFRGSLSRGLCMKGSLSRGCLSRGVSVQVSPHTVEERVVCILLECILVVWTDRAFDVFSFC